MFFSALVLFFFLNSGRLREVLPDLRALPAHRGGDRAVPGPRPGRDKLQVIVLFTYSTMYTRYPDATSATLVGYCEDRLGCFFLSGSQS